MIGDTTAIVLRCKKCTSPVYSRGVLVGSVLWEGCDVVCWLAIILVRQFRRRVHTGALTLLYLLVCSKFYELSLLCEINMYRDTHRRVQVYSTPGRRRMCRRRTARLELLDFLRTLLAGKLKIRTNLERRSSTVHSGYQTCALRCFHDRR